MIAMKQHAIRLSGILVFALCVAANASSSDLALRARCHRSRISAAQRETGDSLEPDVGFFSASPGLPGAIVTRRAPGPVGSPAAPAGLAQLVPPQLVWDQFRQALSLLPRAMLPLSVPSGRAPPSL